MRLPARLAALALAVLAVPAAAQFGQNHVVTRDFDWRVRSTEHFDVYYYRESEPLVPEAARILEQAFAKESRALGIQTEAPVWAAESARKRASWQRRPFFLYASPNDFQQSNIAQVGDGTGGVTEPFKDRFMVYNDGTTQWLEEVIWHELTHIFQFHVLVSGFWRSGRILKSIVYPLWMMEGMPGLLTHGIESTLEEVTIRDAASSGALIPLTKLEHFGHLKPHQITLAYKQGAAAMAFLSAQYGGRKPGDMLRLFENRIETSHVLHDLIGIDAFQFDARFREFVEERYRHEIRRLRLREPDAFGAALTRTPDNIPQFNVAPVFSPDRATMYYLSTAHGYPPELRSMDLRTGRSRRVAPAPWARVESVPLGNFANLSRSLDISKDGRFVLFSGTRNHEDALFLYDTRRGALEKRRVPGFETINQPRFSPDGRAIAFSGMRRSRADLYLYHLDSGKVDQLTDDAPDESMAAFTPDGRALVYSGEIVDAVDPHGEQRRLFRLDLADKTRRILEETGAEARDPVVSEDGKRVLFIRDGDGLSDLCELDLETGKAYRLTRTIGGSFTPAYVGDEIAFASLRGGSVHIYKGPRADFLREELPAAPRRAAGDVAFTLPGMGGVQASTAAFALSPERPYRFSYSTDLFFPALFYSSPGGLFVTTYWQGSDMLGDHVNTALVNYHNAKSYDYQTNYVYSRLRPQLFVGAAGTARQDLVDLDTSHSVNDTISAEYAGVAFPLDRYHRLEAQATVLSERIDDLTNGAQTERREGRRAGVSFVRDTVRGRYLVATRGDRLRAGISRQFNALGGNQLYDVASLEAHRFVQTGSQAALAFRGFAAQTVGRDHPQLVLGGLGGVRGYGRSSYVDAGQRLGVVNAEWRFPIAPDLNYYMWYFFPDFYFKAIFGTVFADTGYAWDASSQVARMRWRDARQSAGLGLRLYTFILQEYPLVIAMDYARRTTSAGGIFYVYLGQLF
jgi:hypothetical protein